MRSHQLLVSSGSQNYWGNGSDGALNTTGDVSLASTLDGDMVVKQYTSLKINAGHTLTVANRCKGLVIYVHGDCTINGTLSMTARGANADASAAGDPSGTAGLKFPRFTANGTDVYTAPSTTSLANAGAAVINTEANQKRINGMGTVFTLARTAGGAGGHGGGNGGFGGSGALGTCFGGGGGGGGGGRDTGFYNVPGDNAAPNGGEGGRGNGGGGAGAGNPGGGTSVANSAGPSGTGAIGSAGTGGTIILIVKGRLIIGATGKIESKGAAGGNSSSVQDNGGGGGGGAGGGAILILYAESFTNSGTIDASGGAGGAGHTNGANGGAGAVQQFQIKT